ncbi:MAG: heavy-metal-associated domain-containing protein [Phycisphaerales bacterium]|nr:MAG: heavy-metal-associated domain-containing protein [Phycisphaerales bacterium]
MSSRLAFDLDCNRVMPECGFECPKCIQEIESTLTTIGGVSKVYIEKEGQEQKLIVEHDPGAVTVEQLIHVLKGLPSFYEGFFVPTVIA